MEVRWEGKWIWWVISGQVYVGNEGIKEPVRGAIGVRLIASLI